MHAEATAPPREGVVVASGYGLKIHIKAGHLVVHDGVGTNRQTRSFNRATSGLRRLVVLGHDGYITLDALHWLRQVGAAFIQLDHCGQIIAQSAIKGSDIAKLRRSQAGAVAAPVGIEVARYLLAEKVGGQAALAECLPGDVRDNCSDIHAARAAIANAVSMDELVAGESAAASAYWRAWSLVSLPFPSTRVSRLPTHWLTVGQRRSPLTRSPRLVSNPANAILNYLYALLEVETTLALQTIGLDPGLGLFHSDKAGRASMSLDVMEACRPAVDAYLLALVTQGALSPRDFVETPRGACRLRPSFAKHLAGTGTVWESHIAPVAAHVAQMLAHAANQPLATKLTQGERVDALSPRRTKPRNATAKSARLLDRCLDCGTRLPNRRHRYCASCRDRRWGAASNAGRSSAARVLQQLRDDGRDPAHGGRAAKVRGEKNAAHQAAVREWDDRNDRPSSEMFRSQVTPRLRAVPISSLVEATGLSTHYCSLIRLGKRTPHPRHWPALESLLVD